MKRAFDALFVLAGVAIVVVLTIFVHHGDQPTPREGQESDAEPTRVVTVAGGPRLRGLGGSGALTPATGHCGVELWALKTLTDPAAGQVVLRPKRTTIAQLVSGPAPRGAHRGRAYGVETQAWRVRATLTGFKLERDSDLHLVLEADGKTLIAELPDVACAQGSRVARSMAAARAAFLAHHNAADGCFDCLHEPVRVDGIGFYDRIHGQAGVAGNGVELHPVTRIVFPG